MTVEPLRRDILRQVLWSVVVVLEKGDLSPYCVKLLEESSVSNEKRAGDPLHIQMLWLGIRLC